MSRPFNRISPVPNDIEFNCEGCGVHVVAFGLATIPKTGLCAMCEWLCEFVPDPEEMMAVRQRLKAKTGQEN
jgi:hypothetical protein